MSKKISYELNPDTLEYEAARPPKGRSFIGICVVAILSSAVIACYCKMVYSGRWTSPKTAILQRENDSWATKMELMNRDLDLLEMKLKDLQLRNEDIYRSIFGMNEIPQDVISSGNSSLELDGILKETYTRLDRMSRRTFIQSKSYDEVSQLSKRAGEMVSCTPAIIPIDPTPGTYRISSVFGRRIDPVYGGYSYHEGMDFATASGSNIYVTGDGVVSKVSFQFFGYGNIVYVDHGFGYRTRYAHMKEIYVSEGMQLKRGDCIGTVGSSGKSTGPHLHYEVEYRGRKVNPQNFFDRDISHEEYAGMVRVRPDASTDVQRPVFQLKKKK